MHPGPGLTFGGKRHTASQDIGGSIHSCFAKAVVKAGEPQVWLSVLTPFDQRQNAADIAGRIKTSLDGAGNATATIGETTVTVTADGDWQVKR